MSQSVSYKSVNYVSQSVSYKSVNYVSQSGSRILCNWLDDMVLMLAIEVAKMLQGNWKVSKN